MKTFDMDRHVIEPIEMWRKYLAPTHRAHAPAWVDNLDPPEFVASRVARLGQRALLPLPPVLAVGKRPVWRGLSEEARIDMGMSAARRMDELRAAGHAEGHLAHMTRAGVATSLLLPTYAPYLVYDDETPPARSRAYADAYNRWLAALCAEEPMRLLGAALLSRAEPSSMVADLERVLSAGLVAAVVRAEPVRGLTLNAAVYHRFFEACASNGVAVLIHGGTHARVATAGADRFSTHFGQHMCSHPLEVMMGLVALLESGLLARLPNLRVGLLECGSSWLPHWLYRLDEIWRYCRAELRGRVDEPPSFYVRQQCFIAVEPGEVLLRETVEQIGAEHFVYGSDYPHLDHPTQLGAEIQRLRSTVGEAAARKILVDNPLRLLGLSVPPTPNTVREAAPPG